MVLGTRKRQFNIDVTHSVIDDIWVATSNDIRGLVVESEGFQTFLSDLFEVSAELLTHNLGASIEQLDRTTLLCHVTHEEDRPTVKHAVRPESRISELQLAAA